jgi:ligand-binding sensor domain-containing protein
MGLWLTALCTQAQQLSFYSINEKDNLPSNEVYQVLQGNDGYVYIGCSTGLFSYDGYSFNPIKGKGQNAKSISHLVKDASGKIWCQNFAGQLYFVRNDSLILFRDFSDENLSIPQFAIDGNEVCLPYRKNFFKSNHPVKKFPLPIPTAVTGMLPLLQLTRVMHT